MTELELYKYINDNNIEWHRWHRHLDNRHSVADIIIFPYIFQIDEFAKLIKDYTSDEGMECYLKDGYFAFWMRDLCDYYDIDIDKVFCGDEQ